jgi:hypothetical protein
MKEPSNTGLSECCWFFDFVDNFQFRSVETLGLTKPVVPVSGKRKSYIR